MSGVGGELPKGWVRVRLDEIADVQGGIQKQQKRRPVVNKYPFLRVANVTSTGLDLSDVHEVELFDGEIERFALRTGDLLVVEGNGSISQLGRAARWRGEIEDCVHQNHLIRVRPTSAVSDRFLELLWNSSVVSEQIRRVAASTSGLHTLSTSKIKQVDVPLPPLSEQLRIVTALEEQLSRLDEAIKSIEASRLRASQLWASVLEQVVQGTLNPVSKQPVPWVRTDSVAVVQGGVQKQSRRRPVDNRFPFLRVANVPRGRLALDDVHEIELFGNEIERYRLKAGDLLVVEGNGSPDQIGRAALWHNEIEDCVHQNHLIRVRPSESLRPAFLEIVWNSPSVTAELKRVASSTSGLHTLSTSKVKSVEIPHPTLEEQDALVTAANVWKTKLHAAETAQAAALARSSALRRSLLTEAFAGRLAPQDPNDEPAEELLARIRAEREAAAPKKRRTRRAPAQRKATHDEPPPAPTNTPTTPLIGEQPTLDLEFPS